MTAIRSDADHVPMVLVDGKNWDGSDVCFTLTANNANGAQRMPDKENLSCVLVSDTPAMETYHCEVMGGVSPTLKARDYKDPNVVFVDADTE